MKYYPIIICLLVLHSTLGAQQSHTNVVTAEDYAQAESFLAQHTNPLVFGATVNPRWLDDGRFWFQSNGLEGINYFLVNPKERSRAPAFDQSRLANVLTGIIGRTIEPSGIPLEDLWLESNTLMAIVGGQRDLLCDLGRYTCKFSDSEISQISRDEVISPDGESVVFIKDHNLWSRSVATGEELALTTDGFEDFGYGTDT
jgi:dipeptidyl-peptidase-4